MNVRVHLLYIDEKCICRTLYTPFFFFKQKTANELRISDWSSDVCSSDLVPDFGGQFGGNALVGINGQHPYTCCQVQRTVLLGTEAGPIGRQAEIGRASCRERVCQYV